MNEDDLTLVWKALSDPGRRAILDYLKERPRTTGELSDLFEVSRFAVMKNLDLLERAGLVVVRRHGRERWNHLNAIPLQRIYERWLRPYEARWASSLWQLKRNLEGLSEERMTPMSEQATASPAIGFFHIEQEISIEAPPATVFEALTDDISSWWGAPYLLSQNAKALIIEPRVGGRFYEDWGENNGGLWATVSAIKQNEWIELNGPIAMSGVVNGIVRFELQAQGQETLLKLSHRAMGEVNDGLQQTYNSGWHDLLAVRLKAFIEQGIKYGIGHEPHLPSK